MTAAAASENGKKEDSDITHWRRTQSSGQSIGSLCYVSVRVLTAELSLAIVKFPDVGLTLFATLLPKLSLLAFCLTVNLCDMSIPVIEKLKSEMRQISYFVKNTNAFGAAYKLLIVVLSPLSIA